MRGLFFVVSGLLAVPCALYGNPGFGQQCVPCHEEKTPRIVSDWRLSTHSKNDVGCRKCHGSNVHCSMCHGEGYDVRLPTPETCAECHEEQVQQFRQGKHAAAWTAMKAMPGVHAQPVALTEGMKGCGGCHKIGLKTDDEITALKDNGAGFGIASCDACHSRHIFSVQEARQPQACQTCHMGFDHPQWEMYSSSKHGVRYLLKQSQILPESVAAPTCQSCHMPEGDHEVRTAWGFLAVRLPLPEGPQWAEDRKTILRALGILDPQGRPTKRIQVVEAADVARLTEEDWRKERDKMIGVCNQCHSENFARAELEKGDELIKEADHLLAEAVRVVAGLYEDGFLKKPESYAYAFPDLLYFHDAPTVVEQRLFEMHLEYRMRAFQGAFHSNPDYALWYGWSGMKRTLVEIRELARKLRGR